MRPADIQPRTFLELKPARREAYGLTNPYVLCDEVRPNAHGYKRPWIIGRPCPADGAEQGAFLASDFRRALGPIEAGQTADPSMVPH